MASIAGSSSTEDGGKRRSMGAATARLSGEAAESMKKPNDGIWCRPINEDDLLKWEALVLGPALSPYAYGFFTFKMTFTEDYPSNSPMVTFATTGGGKTRFNPNLYADGKVCLSILGTWRGDSGELWSSVQNIQSIMVSIQSLMGDQPYHNEPGFEREKMLEAEGRRGGKTASSVQDLTKKYNLKVQHETLRIAVCDLLEDLCNPETENTSIFPEIVKWHFLLYYQEYLSIANDHLEETGAFETTEFEFPRNTMMGSYDFKSIVTRIEGIKDMVEKETREWQTKGAEATARGIQSYDCQQINMALQKFNRVELDGISASPQDGNIFVWDVTIMGGLGGGWWENGIYTLKLVFPPDFPDSPPRPKFDTSMFHPQISNDGYPFVSVSMADWRSVSAIITDIHNLLRNPPSPDPRTWVNKEAADLYFNQGDKGRDEYAKKVRRCAQRSMECI